MKLPLILINFKCYKTGVEALKLAKSCDLISKKYEIKIAVAPQFVDIYRISKEIEIPVFSQHVDPIEVGAFTGHVSIRAIKEAGAIGTLINHSERRLGLDEIEKCVNVAKKYGLRTACCSRDLRESEKIAHFDPDFIAYEDPALIGTGRPISKEKPETVREFVETVKNINPNIIPLCGAGISSGEDVKIALDLGCKGVLIASAVVKAEYPEKVLESIAKSLMKINQY